MFSGVFVNGCSFLCLVSVLNKREANLVFIVIFHFTVASLYS